MGTSTGYSLPKTGNWPDLKREVTNWGNLGVSTPANLGNIMNDYVRAYGGAGTQAQQSSSANRAGAKLGGILSRVRSDGLGAALEDVGLGALVGRSVSDVMQGIRDYLIDDGSSLDDELIRSAFDDFLEEVIGQHDTYEELDAAFTRVAVMDTVGENMEKLFGHFVYKKFKRDFSERLLKAAGSLRSANRLLRDIKDYIFDTIRASLHGRDLSQIDWRGNEGLQMSQEIHASVWRVFGEN